MLATKEKTSLPVKSGLGSILSRDLEEWFDRPFGELIRSFRENMLSDLLGNSGLEFPVTIEPAVNMHVEGNSLVIEVMVPGIKKEELKIETAPNFLTIVGEAKSEKEVKKEDVLYKQFSSTRKYHLQLQLPVEVRAEKADAHLSNGILTVKIPTVETIQATKVPINVK